MFGLPQTAIRRDGIVTEFDIDYGLALTAGFHKGVRQGSFSDAYRASEFNAAEEDSPYLTADQANARFAVPGLVFDSAVTEAQAWLIRERHKAHLNRLAFIEHGSRGWARKAGVWGAEFVGQFLNPVDIGLSFLPIARVAKAGTPLLGISGKAVNVSKLRSSVNRGFFDVTSVKNPLSRDILGAAIDGMAGQILAEPLAVLQNAQSNFDYTAADSVVNVVAGGVFGGGFRLGIEGMARTVRFVSAKTHARAAGKTLDNILKDKPNADAHLEVALDNRLIREDVAFDELAARAEAIRAVDASVSELDAVAQAKMDLEDSLGTVNQKDLLALAEAQINMASTAKRMPENIRIAKSLLGRIKGGANDQTSLQNLAALFGLEFDPMAKVYPELFRFGESKGEPLNLSRKASKAEYVERVEAAKQTLADIEKARQGLEAEPGKSGQQAANLERLNLEKTKAEAELGAAIEAVRSFKALTRERAAARERRLQALVARERERRINDYIAHARGQYDAPTGRDLNKLQEIRRLKEEGTFIDAAAEKKYSRGDDLSVVEEDVQALELSLRRAIEAEPDPQEKARLEEGMRREMEDVLPPQELAIHTAADCILRNMI